MAIMEFTKWENAYRNTNGAISRDVVRIRKEGSRGQLHVGVYGDRASNPFPRGSTVYVRTPKYNVSGKVWYIYYGMSAGKPFYNLYVDKPYQGDDVGGVVSNQPIPISPAASAPVLPDQSTLGETVASGEGVDAGAPTVMGGGAGLPIRKYAIWALAAIAGFLVFKKMKKK